MGSLSFVLKINPLTDQFVQWRRSIVGLVWLLNLGYKRGLLRNRARVWRTVRRINGV